jgi:hypothetical protein
MAAAAALAPPAKPGAPEPVLLWPRVQHPFAVRPHPLPYLSPDRMRQRPSGEHSSVSDVGLSLGLNQTSTFTTTFSQA